jgi:phosphopantothenoylcysteine synthetase/decarboxylase
VVLLVIANNSLKIQRRPCIMLSTDDVTLIPSHVARNQFAGPNDDEHVDDDVEDDDEFDDEEWEDEFDDDDEDDEVEWDDDDLSDMDEEAE